jgi:hypothetical protein
MPVHPFVFDIAMSSKPVYTVSSFMELLTVPCGRLRFSWVTSARLGFPPRSFSVLLRLAFAFGGHVSGSWAVFPSGSVGAGRFFRVSRIAPVAFGQRCGCAFAPVCEGEVAFPL